MPPRHTTGAATGLNWRIAARFGYIAVIFLATLTDMKLGPGATDGIQERLQRALMPMLSARDVIDGLRNLLLFAGWGLVWSLTERTPRFLRSVLLATVTGMLLSVCVEAAQLVSPRRQSSILDVLTNTGGAFLGALAVVLLLRVTIAARSARSFVGMPMLVIAVAYCAAAMLEILLPGMRQDLLPGIRGGPLARFRLALEWFGWRMPSLSTFVLQFILLLPAGWFSVAAMVERGRSYVNALLWTTAAGVVLAMLFEIGRGFTGQPVEFGVFVAHAAGIVCGAWLAWHYLALLTTRLRGRSRPLALMGVYAVVLMLWRWRPFRPAFDIEHMLGSFSTGHLVPLAALAGRTDLFSASIVAAGFLLHVPLGALLAVWPLRYRGALAHVLPGLWFVILIEAGQLFITERFFDTTDIVIGTAGVLAGWALMRQAGFRPYGQALPPAGS
ncbi:hypothetical protein BH23GEM9_BH23GEM9_20590 [soil metagenome]